MALGTTLGAMNTLMFRPRYLCLALLAMAVIHGHLQAARSGAAPGSTGLTRLSRDLMRLAESENSAPATASGNDTSPGRRARV